MLRTELAGVWHYYNHLDGERADLTDSQFTDPGARFEAPGLYADELTDRDTAMVGIPQREYDALRAGFLARYQEAKG